MVTDLRKLHLNFDAQLGLNPSHPTNIDPSMLPLPQNHRATAVEDLPLVMTPAEVAQALGIGKNSIYALLRSGALKSLRVGRLIKITRSALEEYLQGY
jgi:excisionase family DNA binding protein